MERRVIEAQLVIDRQDFYCNNSKPGHWQALLTTAPEELTTIAATILPRISAIPAGGPRDEVVDLAVACDPGV